MKATKIVIVGGGLAGLTAGLELRKYDLDVSVIEKNSYPRHKVCGEYVSNEVLQNLKNLGIDPGASGAVSISKLQCSSLYGKSLEVSLPLGGFGISRYALDNLLYNKFLAQGGTVLQEQVTQVDYINDTFEVKTISGKTCTADYVIGAYGKRATLDISLSRKFIEKKSPWMGVKMHYKHSWESNKVALHNFEGGYCGISRVEEGRVNVCYLANTRSFKKYKNLERFKQEVLSRNQYLNEFFSEAEPLFEKPLTISQISFDLKKRVEDHLLMCGDSASLIHPLCGNGMAMAISGARILSDCLVQHLEQNSTRAVLEKDYDRRWQTQFNSRVRWGRGLQRILTSNLASNYGISLMRYSPGLLKQIIKTTHGKA